MKTYKITFKINQSMQKDTNYPAQMEQLNQAGINPGLLYGMSYKVYEITIEAPSKLEAEQYVIDMIDDVSGMWDQEDIEKTINSIIVDDIAGF